jgi:hypothetical protein
VVCMVEMRNAYKTFVEEPIGKRPFGWPRCRCEDNARMDLRETGWENVDWVHLALDGDQW